MSYTDAYSDPRSYRCCTCCGALVADEATHNRWHDGTVGEACGYNPGDLKPPTELTFVEAPKQCPRCGGWADTNPCKTVDESNGEVCGYVQGEWQRPGREVINGGGLCQVCGLIAAKCEHDVPHPYPVNDPDPMTFKGWGVPGVAQPVVKPMTFSEYIAVTTEHPLIEAPEEWRTEPTREEIQAFRDAWDQTPSPFHLDDVITNGLRSVFELRAINGE